MIEAGPVKLITYGAIILGGSGRVEKSCHEALCIRNDLKKALNDRSLCWEGVDSELPIKVGIKPYHHGKVIDNR